MHQRGIPTIWYCRGDCMEKNLCSVIYAIEKGFWIGNHSYSHPYFSKISLETCREEIHKTEALIDRAYHQAGMKRPNKLFRFPFGDKGGGKNILKEYTQEESERINGLQDLLRNEGFQRAHFEGVTYPYFLKAHLDRDIDAAWTFDTKDFVLLSKASQDKSGLHNIADFEKRMDLNDPENGFGLNEPSSSDIVILHDFEEDNPSFRTADPKTPFQKCGVLLA